MPSRATIGYEPLRYLSCDNSAMNVTMKDIAQELGISIGTVSKVLRDHPDISEETRERVRTRMRELNYRPNLAARALVTGRTYSIGLIVPDLGLFFGEVAGGLSRLLRKNSYSLIISSSDEDVELENRAIEQLLARRVDALILASCQRDSGFYQNIERQNTPFVLIDRQLQGAKVNFVGVNDEEIGRMATEHLIEMGCRRIAHIGGPAISTAAGRLRGYQKALDGHRRPLDQGYIIGREHAGEASDITGYQAMKKLLAGKRPPDGIFCFNDPTAMGAMQAAIEKGVRIPRDLALVGSGNVRYAKFLRVPLSTIDQQSEDLGDRAAKLALKLIESKIRPKPSTILLTPRLIVRESSSRIKQSKTSK
jgi:LacI family transcriptional regulator